MKVTLNGKEDELQEGISVADLLALRKIRANGAAASHNTGIRRLFGMLRMPPLSGPSPKPARTLRDDIADWCAKQPWIFYSPWPLYFAYVLLRYWHAIIETFLYPSVPTYYACWFDGINLGIHELGHYVFAPFGDFLHVAGGSILQCAIPVICFATFWRQGHYFALGVMGATMTLVT